MSELVCTECAERRIWEAKVRNMKPPAPAEALDWITYMRDKLARYGTDPIMAWLLDCAERDTRRILEGPGSYE